MDNKTSQIESLENEVVWLNDRNQLLEQRLANIEAQLAQNNGQKAQTAKAEFYLGQNIPNPTTGSTVIPYFIPGMFREAFVTVSNKQGAIVKQVAVSSQGWGQIEIDLNGFATGSYQYSLVIDGKIQNTKTMILMNRN
mgnify:FL=1